MNYKKYRDLLLSNIFFDASKFPKAVVDTKKFSYTNEKEIQIKLYNSYDESAKESAKKAFKIGASAAVPAAADDAPGADSDGGAEKFAVATLLKKLEYAENLRLEGLGPALKVFHTIKDNVDSFYKKIQMSKGGHLLKKRK